MYYDLCNSSSFFPYGATAPNGALAYLHDTLRFTSVFLILDRR
jgi:hypothetical protein